MEGKNICVRSPTEKEEQNSKFNEKKNSFSIANWFESIFSPQCAVVIFVTFIHSQIPLHWNFYPTTRNKKSIELNRVLLIINSNNKNRKENWNYINLLLN